MRPGWSPIARSPVSTPGVNDARSSESWRMVRVSPDPAEDDLLVGDQAADPQAVHADAVDVGARGRRRGRWRSRRAPARSPASRAGGGDQLRRTPRGAGGRVGLVGVVQLDDLDRLVERRRGRGEAHHQHRADREVRGDQHAGPRGVGQPAAQRRRAGPSSKPVVPTTAWMPWPTQNSRLSITTSGWVKSTTASAPAATRSSSASSASIAGHQLEVVGRLDRPAHLGADPAPRAQHARPSPRSARTHRADNLGHRATRRVPVTAPAAVWQAVAHGAADDPGPDPVGGRAHGRPARRPRARDRLRSGRRRRADLQRLETGKLFAIDRSESGVDRTKRRNAAATSRPAGSPSARSTWPPCGCR